MDPWRDADHELSKSEIVDPWTQAPTLIEVVDPWRPRPAACTR